MLGRVGQILTQMGQSLKGLYTVVVSSLMSFWKRGFALKETITTMTHTAQHILSKVRVATQWTTEQLLVQSQILLDTLMKAILTLVLLTVGVVGLSARIIVALLHKLASKAQKKDQ